MPIPQVGQTAPDFELLTDAGEKVKLSDFQGRRVALFFYPKADTPGCTKEACRFRDDYSAYQKKDIVVLGISPDTPQDQANFKAKYSLPYPLLADADHRVSEAYGLWGQHRVMTSEKPLEYLGVWRTTFLIDEEGKISQIIQGIPAEAHSEAVLGATQ